jgi:hypothetical protein
MKTSLKELSPASYIVSPLAPSFHNSPEPPTYSECRGETIGLAIASSDSHTLSQLDSRELKPDLELPGAFTGTQPPRNIAELPTTPSRSYIRDASRVSNTDNPATSDRCSSRRSDPSKPHAMSWASYDGIFEDGRSASAQGNLYVGHIARNPSSRLSGPNTSSEWGTMAGGQQGRNVSGVVTPIITVTSASMPVLE